MSEPLPAGPERRHSPRREFDLPVRVQGRSPGGASLETTGRALNVSEHGVRLECGAQFPRGTEVEIQSPERSASARYRVVWIAARPGRRWEMGVELVSGQPLFQRAGTASDSGGGI
jgi:hypothetical protein